MAELKKRDGSSTKETSSSASSRSKADSAAKESKPKTRVDEDGRKVTQAKPSSGNATGLRVGAVILWVLAIGFEILCAMILFGKINVTKTGASWPAFVALGLDLVCVIIGSQLWKKANRIDPASSKNKTKFWLWNNMGLIVTIFAFVPLIVLLFAQKDKLDSKTRMVAIIAAIIALLIGGLASYDFNPVSQEGKNEAITEIGDDTTVYWTQFGKVYHLDSDCQHIAKSDYYEGTVKEAIEANRERLCKSCAGRHSDLSFTNNDVVED
ncbi:MAG: hypothetical protein J5824_04570 [Lachnospiraceae bacterium]|nr:hypothetical protein [Lachnospiraceae bacterium]